MVSVLLFFLFLSLYFFLTNTCLSDRITVNVYIKLSLYVYFSTFLIFGINFSIVLAKIKILPVNFWVSFSGDVFHLIPKRMLLWYFCCFFKSCCLLIIRFLRLFPLVNFFASFFLKVHFFVYLQDIFLKGGFVLSCL